MLTPDSQLQFVRLEYQRTADFRAYCAKALARARCHDSSLPEIDSDCLAVLMSDGKMIGVVLLEAFLRQQSKEAWQLAAEAAPAGSIPSKLR